jgi:shikimate dehydrogenase
MTRLDQHTRMVGLLGYPLHHSFSPAMHNEVFEQLEMGFVYLPLKVKPGRLGEAIAGLRALHFVGANVTIPHKESIIPYLDALSPEAELVGAVNTLYWNAQRQLVGDNTDVVGFDRTLSDGDIDLEGRSVAIIGSGGAARAVAVALARRQVKEIIVVARRQIALQQFIHDLKVKFPDILWTAHTQSTPVLAQDLERVWLLVNASPVGMYPHVSESPLSQTFLGMLPAGAHVYDLVYNPPRTQLLQWAETQGYHTHEGLHMLAYQGAAAFERWTGLQPPIAPMLQSLTAQIKAQHKQNTP